MPLWEDAQDTEPRRASPSWAKLLRDAWSQQHCADLCAKQRRQKILKPFAYLFSRTSSDGGIPSRGGVASAPLRTRKTRWLVAPALCARPESNSFFHRKNHPGTGSKLSSGRGPQMFPAFLQKRTLSSPPLARNACHGLLAAQTTFRLAWQMLCHMYLPLPTESPQAGRPALRCTHLPLALRKWTLHLPDSRRWKLPTEAQTFSLRHCLFWHPLPTKTKQIPLLQGPLMQRQQ
mmetsp:Transcript_4112/g.9617  ORF Transcript_4112/g.9617 Transcript_4112/m.9617 type:complete len:233 (-) Transcript_4112:362-1060(-)